MTPVPPWAPTRCCSVTSTPSASCVTGRRNRWRQRSRTVIGRPATRTSPERAAGSPAARPTGIFARWGATRPAPAVEPVHGVEHRDQVPQGRPGLYVVDGVEHNPAARSENLTPPQDLLAHLLRRAERERLLRIDA